MSMNQGVVKKVAGPLVVATGLDGSGMFEVARVGEDKLFGEIIEVRGGEYSIQVYETTEGIGPGDPVFPTGQALSVELGPGLITAIYDGIQRPLDSLQDEFGDFILRGAELPGLSREKTWHFVPKVSEGDQVAAGDILGTVQETELIEHRIMVPPDTSGRVASIKEVEAPVTETVCVLETDDGTVELSMMQKWPVRVARPVQERVPPVQPLITGQRVIDTLFPLGKGGTACVPGPFGSGKTVVQHQLAKWADAEIVVYVGCGERGNEMTDVLMEFPELQDPISGRPLIERTVMIANTSNMPVAAREASVFCGITLAEYFRDMGYNVAMMADSTSRWAEAMREISGRLEEMPGEEGFPAYLASRIAGFYERAGSVRCQGSDDRQGTLSLIGAVSPPGGDLSEPVVQATLRVVKVFWGLDDALASQRHFPAINWLNSYSLYEDVSSKYAKENIDEQWPDVRRQAMWLLNREAELEELVRLVGVDALSAGDRLILQGAKMVREDFLHQNAFDPVDTYTSAQKQFRMLANIVAFYEQARQALDQGANIDQIVEVDVLEEIARAKLIDEDNLDEFDNIRSRIEEQLNALIPETVEETS
jgi:V/A-type H+-transporting ATPase subunit A